MKRLLALLLLIGCSKASDSSKQMPKLPPPPRAEVPAGVHIDVEVSGHAAPPLDSARLSSTRPDFEDAEHRAWKLSTLLPEAHGSFTVSGEHDVTVQFHPDGERQPALMLTRRGELVALLVDVRDPFPQYHGQGRRLGRPGDPLPHLSGVKKITAE